MSSHDQQREFRVGDRITHTATRRTGRLVPETFWGTNYVGLAIRYDDSPVYAYTVKGLHEFDILDQFEPAPSEHDTPARGMDEEN